MTMRRPPSLSAVEDQWQRDATAAALRAARKMIGDKIPMMTPVGRLSDYELGWLISAAICAWIAKRAEQACAEGFDLALVEDALRNPGKSPPPWDVGAVATILPDLADIKDIDWNLSLNDWPKETMIRFLLAAFELMRQGFAARDAGGTWSSRRPSGIGKRWDFEDAPPCPTSIAPTWPSPR
jgi:hypothetical protein